MSNYINLQTAILDNIRDVPDFPKAGIVFKDITPLLYNAPLLRESIQALAQQLSLQVQDIDALAGIEARGFIFGALLAQEMQLPFIPIRKPGKLPYKTKFIEYALEYGSACIEIHEDAIEPGQNIVIVDDLLATGGTAEAAAKLVKELGGNVKAYTFMIELSFLTGKSLLEQYAPVISLVSA